MVDYSNAIFDPDDELLGQTANCPVHIAAMHFSARACIARLQRSTLRPGDVVVLNDPYEGGTHTPDVTFTCPVFYEGELIGYGVSRAHWTDVGAAAQVVRLRHTHWRRGPAAAAGEAHRARASSTRDLVAIIRNCTRVPQYVDGDIQAQLGALHAGRDRVDPARRPLRRRSCVKQCGKSSTTRSG